MKAHLGMETDAQQQQRLYTQGLQNQKFALDQQNIQSEIAQRAAGVRQMQSAVTLPNGMQVPFALAKPYIDAWGKQQAAATGKRFMIVPNVGMLDTQADGGPKLVPGSSPQGVQVTPDIAQQYNIPLQMIGKSIPLGQFAQLERGGAAWAGSVSNTTDHIEVDDPNNPGQKVIATFPKTTTSQKVAPTNKGSSVMPTATPQGPGQQPVQPTPQGAKTPPVSIGNNNGVKFLKGPDGQPLTKGGGDTVYAFDPASGQQVFTTRADAITKGYQTPTKVTVAQAGKDKDALTMLNDVQMNASKYVVASRDYFKNGGNYSQDGPLLAKLMSENPFNISSGAIDLKLPAADIINNVENSKAYTALTPAGKELFDGWLRSNAAVPAYQKGLTNIGRANKEMMDLELKNIPSPILGMDDIQRRMQAFQQNIDQASHKFPIFQDVKQPRQVRQQIEGVSNPPPAGEPARPANVPQNYIYKVNGPKGTGWYRP